jgi:type IV pilus assembly protein PilW
MKKIIHIKNSYYSHRQQGFSLLEIMITLSVGLVLLAGVLSVFEGLRTTTKETTSYGELEENGRFAISLLTDDLIRQDFWGDYTGTFDLASINPVPAPPTTECTGAGVNNGTFPLAVGHFRTLWGDRVTNASLMGCISDAVVYTAPKSSDIIQIKRVVAAPLVTSTTTTIGGVTTTTISPVTTTPAGNYYLVSNFNSGVIFSSGTVPTITNGQVWQYQHHIYYVREETQGSNTVPVLMQGQLTSTMTFAPIIDGIEIIHFMYGLDTDGDNIINAYVAANNMTADNWNNAGSTILAVKIYVLARNVTPDNKYNNNNTYNLGDMTFTANDNFRRLLFTSTVTLFNARVDTW